MRKYLLVFILILTGCINNGDQRPLKKFVIGFSQCTMIDEWRQTMVEEMKREISFYRNYDIELIVKDAEDNNEKQIADISDLISKKIDLLIVSPNEAEPLTPTVEKVFDMGIPVIIVDRKINSPKYTAYIGANNVTIGEEAGYFAAELLKGKGRVLEISGLKGSTPAKERSAGFHNIIDKYPNIRTIKTIEGSWLESKTLKLTDSLFRVFTDFDLIFAHNDFMAIAAYKSARKYNLKPYLIGVDGMNTPTGGVSMVINGFIDGTIFYPSGGDKAIQLAIQILEGKEFNKDIELSTYRIDNSNGRTLWLQGQQLREQQNKIDKQNAQLNQMAEMLAKRRVLLLMTYSTIILLIITITVILISWRNKNRMYKILDEKNKTIIKQNQIIIKQRDDSLNLLIVAEEARENKLRLFTDLSHELRTVITLIINPIQDILNLAQDESLRKKVMVLQRSAERLARLTDDILKFRSIDNNKYRLTYYSGNIAQFISNIVDTFHEQAERKQIKLISNIENQLFAEFDPGVIEKVMYNMLSNAIKYCKASGQVSVSLKSENSKIIIIVQDTGIGIPKNELPFIFNRFYRINRIKNPNYSSENETIGIGLALSKELIQLHGGEITVDSEENIGTSFTITLPQFHNLSDLKTNVKTLDLRDANIDFSHQFHKGKTILVVEDNADLITVISDILSKQYNVISAQNGKEGFDLAIKNLPDLIISDILMPVMDGMKMCIEIKNNPITCHIPIILLTAIDSEENMIKGFDIGADAYITKPFNEYLLLSNIKNLIESREKMKQFFCPSPFLRNVIQTKDSDNSDFIRNCLNNIYENLEKENYTLDNLSDKMNMSRSSLYRKIKEATGLRPVDFIKKAKLNYAAKLILSDNTRPINEIAWKSGFSDSKYFSKCFYREFGVQPSRFDNNYFKENDYELVKNIDN